jgi:hypothetical protein
MNSDDYIENWSVSWQTSTILVSMPISLFNNVAITAGYNIVLFFDFVYLRIIPKSGKK